MAQKVGSDGQVRKSAAAWAADTRIYDQGTRLFNTGDIDDDPDATKFKLADGFHAWADLEYYAPGSGGGGGIAAVNATSPLTASGTTTRTIAATTSDGGNAATDAGKLAIYDATGKLTGSSATTIGVEGIASGTASAGVQGTGGTTAGVVGTGSTNPGGFFSASQAEALKVVSADFGDTQPIQTFNNQGTGEVLRVNNDGTFSPTIGVTNLPQITLNDQNYTLLGTEGSIIGVGGDPIGVSDPGNLPARGVPLFIKNNMTAFDVTFSPDGSLDGSGASVVIPPGGSLTIESLGSGNWTRVVSSASLGLPNVYFATVDGTGTVQSEYNQQGGTPAWSNPGDGILILTNTGKFTVGKTSVNASIVGNGGGAALVINIEFTSVDVITFYTNDLTTTPTPPQSLFVHVSVYP